MAQSLNCDGMIAGLRQAQVIVNDDEGSCSLFPQKTENEKAAK
jgi:hypothetical protein